MTTKEALAVKAAVRSRDGHKCIECGMTEAEHRAKMGKDLEVHRVIPQSVYTLDGCETLCKWCHGKKPKGVNVSHVALTETFCFYTTQSFHDRLKATSRSLNIGMSDFIRMVVTQRMDADGIPRPKQPPAKARRGKGD